MSSVRIKFEFDNGQTELGEFDGESGLIQRITDYADELTCDVNEDREEDADEVCLDDWTVESFDTDWTDMSVPDDFADLDEWGEYCEKVDEYGEAYVLRYHDVCSCDMDDEYAGVWGSFEDFAENFFDDCMECPDGLRNYIDMELWSRDLSYDYSAYEGSEGTHVFRNC